MDHDDGFVDFLSPPLELEAFRSLIATTGKRQPSRPQLRFVKKLGSIPTMSLPVEDTCKSALNLTERGLIG